ncbi:succinylglutamate desuccinylase [Kordia sp. SMS9]|uniref:succinylglutamate desuccinylase/aspartoacylase domain-containing protein n=1 Tax=Kordia sp. SMS9 TaxID=2282170 RepID=UPI000E0DD01D|nr:succinylglutamate desuccinylase/aspartoacylase family protein [Kordia sp. SMS9]AXG68562.1 succinylglutamate desuccinylase [Kordia sp. SMS9]
MQPHLLLDVKRTIYSHTNPKATKTLVFIGGIHGNEPAGIYGLQHVIAAICKHKLELQCNLYALAGNLNAIQKNIRYETTDLNRLWTHENIQKITSQTTFNSQEEKEQAELHECIQDILNTHSGTFIFIDLHTTSSETIPFITISDSLKNRAFVSNFQLPIILGIEEYLDGPLLTYINEFGYIALGFEAGQHEDPEAVKNCETFIWQALMAAEALTKHTIEPLNVLPKNFLKVKNLGTFYEISDRYHLKKEENFTMKPGFKNFDTIQKSQEIATSNSTTINANVSGKIFMPLYQKQGDDGFFIITEISTFWLKLSSMFRTLNLHHVLRILPGVQQDKSNANALIVNPKIAAFLATKIFHLFGYRKKVLKSEKWYFIKRD